MLTVSEVLVFFVLSLLLIEFLKLQWMRRHFPPGPTPYPFFGNLLQMNFKIHHEHLKKMAKIHGNIFTLWISNTPVIVLQGFQAVKEGLTAHAEDVAGRPESRIFQILTHGNGVLFSNGHLWKQQRRFGMATMRKMGLGKKKKDYLLQEEAAHLVEYLQKTNDDENFHRLIESFDTLAAFLNSISFYMYELSPWLAGHFLPSVKKMKSCRDFVEALLVKELEIHKGKRKLDENQHFIDYYLDEIDKTKGDADATYDEENLIQTVADLFVAGIETTATTLLWALLYMVIYPDIQEKVQKELDAVVGCSHVFCYEDRKRLPYTNAVIHEIQRYSNILLIALPRMSVKDTELLGYRIPKNTVVLSNIDSVLADPGKWETPDQFNPGHFLDKDGNFVNREAFLPFAIGHRVCMGELLARMELFIVFSTLLQAFTFTLPEGVKEVNTKFVFGSTMKPLPYQLCAIPR
ncbi:cytochrome P450 2J6-like isoform X2 [Geospiza fortis]|uniref:Cytochrome P450 2J6-like isoform X2 n=1 Tax=Geospiza fortis TaxID=48883 RepID=A0A6I9HFD4_GEOFO|nr:cytochrome P450 2J6-like isoform X2 [Geospiza fortis]